jgi:hypothetical protein
VNLIQTNIAPPIIRISDDAVARRDSLLGSVAFLLSVANAEELVAASEALRELKTHCKEVEDSRKYVKEPVLAAERLIDSLAKDHLAPVLLEVDRIDLLIRDRRIAEAQRVAQENDCRRREQEEADRKLREEQERIAREQREAEAKAERERQEAARKLREAEEAALAPQREAEAQAARERAAKIRAEQDAAEAQRKIDADKRQRELDEAAALHSARLQQVAPAATLTAVKGQSVKTVVRFEVTDPALLYRSHPECFDLKERRSIIQAEISAGRWTVAKHPMGVRVFEEIDVTTSAKRNRSAGLVLEG